MSTALLIVPPFWDPVCVPLGISSLKRYAEAKGHIVDLFDFNVEPQIFNCHRTYFLEAKRQIEKWRYWNIERNGTEAFAMHQVLNRFAKGSANYRDMVCEVLNLDETNHEIFQRQIEIEKLDSIIDTLFYEVESKLNALLIRRNYDLIGCSLFNSTWAGALAVLKQAKIMCPWIRTVVGGPGPLIGITAESSEINSFLRKNHFIDYYVIGAGEEKFVRILDEKRLERGIVNESTERTANQQTIPLSVGFDYGELPVERYLQLSISTSRGCPFECSFCAETVFWGGVSQSQIVYVANAMDALSRRYNRRSFYICDSLSNHAIGSLTKSLRDASKSYMLDCYLRPDKTCVDLSKIQSWSRGGLFRARLGMESASQRVLDHMNKANSVEIMSRSLISLSSANVLTSTLWITGYPQESEPDFMDTLRFIREHKSSIYQADAWAFQYRPTGLAQSEEINETWGNRLRFSQETNESLGVTSYLLREGISSEERFDRLERFVTLMGELNIPNPYSVFEWAVAEERWRRVGHQVTWSLKDNYLGINE